MYKAHPHHICAAPKPGIPDLGFPPHLRALPTGGGGCRPRAVPCRGTRGAEEERAFGRVCGCKGYDKGSSSTGTSNKNTTKAEMAAELISHRERRRRLFAKVDKDLEEDKNLAAGLISYREYISLLSEKVKGRERESQQPELRRLPFRSVKKQRRPSRGGLTIQVRDSLPMARREMADMLIHPFFRSTLNDVLEGEDYVSVREEVILGEVIQGEREEVILGEVIQGEREEVIQGEVIQGEVGVVGKDVCQGEEDLLSMDVWQGEQDVFGMDVWQGEDGREFVTLDGVVWQTGLPKSEIPPMRVEVEKEVGTVSVEHETPEPEVIEGPMIKEVEKEVGMVSVEEHETPEPEVMENDQPHWISVSEFRHYWNKRWSVHYGSFEDITKIPSMRFTSKPVEKVDVHRDTLQIFSVKLAAIRVDIKLPIDVFGVVAVRDPVDHNRNIIFHRKRDDCQTLTEKDPYLVLAGPTRAVMFALNPAIIEVDLKVKGTTESKDRHLSFLVAPLRCYSTFFSHLFDRAYTSMLSTLEFAFGHITFSVEATIFVRVVHGSWPDDVRGLFAAFTTGFTDRSPTFVGNKYSTGTGLKRIILLDSGGEKLPVAGDGKIKFSRRVVSVEGCGDVKVRVSALKGETEIVQKEISFHALEASKSIGEIDISFCKMEVTVFWSLISCYPLRKDELVSTPLEANGTDASFCS